MQILCDTFEALLRTRLPSLVSEIKEKFFFLYKQILHGIFILKGYLKISENFQHSPLFVISIFFNRNFLW